MPGPAPIPTPILKARGSQILPRREGEFSPEPGIPDKPEGLSEAAGKIWDALVDEVRKTGVLCKIDGRTMERYCRTFVLWRIEAERLEKMGTVYVVERGAQTLRKPDGSVITKPGDKIVKRFPGVVIFTELSNVLVRLEQQFGMSPASRARILNPNPQKEEDPGDKRRYLKVV
jgi:P27 family predicted phage terminase small subunit